MEKLNIKFRIAPEVLERMSMTSNLTVSDCISELIDNGKEASNNKGLVDVSIASPNLKNNMKLLVIDHGCGMNEEDLTEKFFFLAKGDYEKKGVHAQLGGRVATRKLCEPDGAYMMLITKKEGYPAIKATWDGKSDPVCEYYDEKEVPVGTTIAIYNAKLDESDAEYYKAYAAMRYSPALSMDFRLKINGEEIKPEDPIYPEFEDLNGVGAIENYETEVLGPKDGQVYKVKYAVRDFSVFYEKNNGSAKPGFNPHRWDVDSDGNCILNEMSRSGAFVKINDIYVVCGNTTKPYIKRKEHPQIKGKRLVIEFPEKLAAQLNFQMNKSAGFVSLERVNSLVPLFNETSKAFESIIQASVERAKTEHEDEVRVYRDARTIPGTNKTVRFTVNNGLLAPKNVFAMRDDTLGGFILNPASSLLKPVSGNIKGFKTTAGAVESVYIAARKAINEARKFQPKFNQGSHPRTTAVNTRDQVLDYLESLLDENFMMMS